MTTAEWEFLRSIMEPSPTDLADSDAEVARQRTLHSEARRAWSAAFQLASAAETRAALVAFTDLPGPQPRAVRGHLYAGSSNPPLIQAVNLIDTDEDIDRQLDDQAALADMLRDGWSIDLKYHAARIHRWLARGEFSRAADFVESTDWSYRDVEPARASIARLIAAPDDLAARLDLIEALRCLPDAYEFDLARFDLLWRLHDQVVDTEADASLRARVLMQLAAFHGNDWESGYSGPTASESLTVAAARIAARSKDAETRASALARIGDARSAAGARGLAAEIYRRVSTDLPVTSDWGRCTYNAGVLLRLGGRPREAISILATLFPSDVDDSAPSGVITEPMRNYRHNAALQISHAHEDLRDYSSALDWWVAAIETYRYRSSCGNCASSRRKQEAAERERLEKLVHGP